MKYFLGIALMVVSVAIFGVRISKKIAFKQNVTGYLKRAADANTIDLANEELTKALNYLEANDITSGHTSILWETPDDDIDFWYRNLKASQKELQNLRSDSALERTNVLIKLRETLLDTGEKTKVTVPDGLSVYPHNKFWAAMTTAAVLCLMIGFILLAAEWEQQQKNEKKTE